jgi:glutathione-regulated potassium-efflux system ancillary protein KefC/glutathione-regulated potassium-efflux system protein KefB
MTLLSQSAIFLAAAVLLVPLTRRFQLGAVLGYLAAGVVIGPWGLGLVTQTERVRQFSELGVVFLLFIIGLELQPSRLWVLRKSVFGLGGAQVIVTAAALAYAAWKLGGLDWQPAVVVGIGLALSSTALVLQVLAERNQLTTRHGREAFAILLFQDLAVIPLLALLPILSPDATPQVDAHSGWRVVKGFVTIALVVAGGRLLLRPAVRMVARFGNQEIFTAASLLVVIGMALLTELIGLSMSLGAFLAGVLLAESEYRHELEADIEPFKGLLLGLFFIAVGMSANITLVAERPLLILGLVLAMLIGKMAVLYIIARIAGAPPGSSRRLGLTLSVGGEFAFVIFGAAAVDGTLSDDLYELLIVVVTVSMLVSPLLLLIDDKILAGWLDRPAKPREYDRIDVPEAPVVIAGFGRVGQIIARALNARRIPFTALEASAQQVDFVRRFGNRIYFGDASRVDMLRAAKVDKARLFVLAIDDVDASIKTAAVMREHFPQVPIIARARNRFHAYKLMDLGIARPYRETFETSVSMAANVLRTLGTSGPAVDAFMAHFREHDEEMLNRQHAVYQDEALLIQTTRQANEELKALFESDADDTVRTEKHSPPVEASIDQGKPT